MTIAAVSNGTAIAILLLSFLVMILLRFPIAYAVGLSSVFCLLSQGLPLSTLCQFMVKGISSFSLMAVPFFITMGVLMGSGGISDKLIALADACVGWMTGGMAMVNIVASYFFGGISGSASADTASLGTILIPMMVDQGYDDDFSTAVTITSSCEGLLVPPSHNMVIYATSAGGISVGSLFLGCIMDMAPIILIATPILLPVATAIGIDPIQFGIMVILNCGIGLLTPPVGAVLFIGSAVGKVKMERVVKATLPFYLCMIVTLLLITFIPEISLVLPKMFG